mgnify:CR=1 FL=1
MRFLSLHIAPFNQLLVGWLLMTFSYLNAQSLSTLSSLVINDGVVNGPILDNNDEYGVSVVSLGDLDGDGVVDIAVGSEKDDTGGKDRGIVHIHFLNADGTIKNSVTITSSTPNGPSLSNDDKYGISIANMGDLDGDGVIEIIVGAYKKDGGGNQQGAAFLHFLNSDGSIKETLEFSSNSSNGPSLNDKDEYGVSVANIGDLDNNGYNDVAIGARKNDTGGTGKGSVHIHFMYKVNGEIRIQSTVKLSGDTQNGASLSTQDEYGASLANIGDLDGDGVNELAVGADKSDAGGGNKADRGIVYIHFMNSDATIDHTVEISHNSLNGPVLLDKSRYGSAIASIGDLNSDGVNEISVGAFHDNTEGENFGSIFIHFMNTDGSLDSTWLVNNTTTGVALMSNPHDNFGRSISALGDINGDGFIEFAIGEPGDSDLGTKRGAVHIISLNGSIVTSSGIVWDGLTWSGGASIVISGGPSYEEADSSKSMIIQAGDTAFISEQIRVASLQVDSNAVLQVSASQCMTVLGAVNVHENASVILSATTDSTYAQYYGIAMERTTVEMVLNHYDWHQIASPVAATTLADLKTKNSIGVDGSIVYAVDHNVPMGDSSHIRWYETEDYNEGNNIGFGSDSSYSDAFGTWYGGKSTDAFDGKDGYMIFVNATLTQNAPLPLKLKITGTTNDSSRSTSTNIDNYGWTMVSNPYPCTIDWETIEERLGTGTNDNSFDFLPTVSVWNPENQNYATYMADGVGTSGIAANNNGTGVTLSEGSRYIAPFQSFWVQRSDHLGEDMGVSDPKVFKVLPTDRVTCEKPKHFKMSSSEDVLMRLKMTSEDNPYSDELLLRFGSQFKDYYHNSKDAHKLSSSNPEVALISTRMNDKSLVIHSRSMPEENTSIPLWTRAPLGTRLKMEIKDIPFGWSIWLLDLETGEVYPFVDGIFEYVNFSKGNNHKFDLIINKSGKRPNAIGSSVFVKNRGVELMFDYPNNKKEVIVRDVVGRVVYVTSSVNEEKLFIAFDRFPKQNYFIQISSIQSTEMFKVLP